MIIAVFIDFDCKSTKISPQNGTSSGINLKKYKKKRMYKDFPKIITKFAVGNN
jgi:hypothetical protein